MGGAASGYWEARRHLGHVHGGYADEWGIGPLGAAGVDPDLAVDIGRDPVRVDLVNAESEVGAVAGGGVEDVQGVRRRRVVRGALGARVDVEAWAGGGVNLVDQDWLVRRSLAAGAHPHGGAGHRLAADADGSWKGFWARAAGGCRGLAASEGDLGVGKFTAVLGDVAVLVLGVVMPTGLRPAMTPTGLPASSSKSLASM